MGQFLENPLGGPIGGGNGGQPQPLIYIRPERIIEAGHHAWHVEDVTGNTCGNDIGIIGCAGGDKCFGLFDAGLDENFTVETHAFYDTTFKGGVNALLRHGF